MHTRFLGFFRLHGFTLVVDIAVMSSFMSSEVHSNVRGRPGRREAFLV